MNSAHSPMIICSTRRICSTGICGDGFVASSTIKGSFYRPELDAVRFFAFLFVFVHHTFQRQADWYQKYLHSKPLCQMIASAVNAGGFGLCLFFALSGYLIGELLRREKERTGNVRIQAFYRRRMLRILPLYLLGISIGLAVAACNKQFQRDAVRLFSDVVLLGNWYVVHNGWNDNPMGHLWSISVEGQFYLFWPWVAKKAGSLGQCAVCLVMIMAANGTLFYLGRIHASLDDRIWANSFVQFYMFAAGILVAILLSGRIPEANWPRRVALMAFALFCWETASAQFHIKSFGPAPSAGSLVAGYSLVAVGCAALLLSLLGSHERRFPRAILYLGRISYGLYVYHFIGLRAAEWLTAHYFRFSHRDFLGTMIGLLLTILFAAFSFKYLETPFLRAKQKIEVIETVPA